MWEVRDPGSKPLTLLGHQALVLPIAFTPDASRLLSFGLDTTVRIWELQQAGAPFVLAKGLATALGVDPILSFAFSSDDTRLYGGVRGGAVSAWELRSAAPPVRVPVPTTALASHRPPAASLFRTGDCRAELIARAMSPLAYRPPEHDIARAVTGVDAPPLSGGPTMQLSPDGRELAVGPRDADAVCVWNFEDRTGRSLSLRRSPGITQVWYSPDGSRLAAANALEIRIWNRSNFDSAPLVIPQLPQTKDVHAVAFSIDNRFVAVGTGDVRVYDLQRPENVLVLRSTPNRAPSALVFAGDGELLVAGSVDGATHLWDVREPSAPPLVLPGEGWVTAVQLSGNGRRLAIAHSNGGADLWTLGAEAAEDLCRRTLRNLTVEEWRRYVGDDLPYERTCSGLAAPGTP